MKLIPPPYCQTFDVLLNKSIIQIGDSTSEYPVYKSLFDRGTLLPTSVQIMPPNRQKLECIISGDIENISITFPGSVHGFLVPNITAAGATFYSTEIALSFKNSKLIECKSRKTGTLLSRLCIIDDDGIPWKAAGKDQAKSSEPMATIDLIGEFDERALACTIALLLFWKKALKLIRQKEMELDRNAGPWSKNDAFTLGFIVGGIGAATSN